MVAMFDRFFMGEEESGTEVEAVGPMEPPGAEGSLVETTAGGEAPVCHLRRHFGIRRLNSRRPRTEIIFPSQNYNLSHLG